MRREPVIPNTAENGTYAFRAADKAGNISEEKTVVLDTVSPKGTLYAGTAQIASGNKTNAEYIKFTASDSLSGIKKSEVKEPNATRDIKRM